MWSNTRILVFSSILIITLGFSLLWFGLKPVGIEPTASSVPTASTSQVLPGEASSAAQATQGVEGERALVIKVVDGDTIEIEGNKTIRLIGIDTPETVDPRRPVGCFGKEASSKTKELLTNKVVILQKDISETDKYKRLLRYIFLPLEDGQTLFVNDYLVREGFAKVVTFPPDVKYNERFREAEYEARINKRGLWGRC